MPLSTEKSKQLVGTLLKRNINRKLNLDYDWKVVRSVSLDEPLTDAETGYRAAKVATFNRLTEALNSASTVEDINKIPVRF